MKVPFITRPIGQFMLYSMERPECMILADIWVLARPWGQESEFVLGEHYIDQSGEGTLEHSTEAERTFGQFAKKRSNFEALISTLQYLGDSGTASRVRQAIVQVSIDQWGPEP